MGIQEETLHFSYYNSLQLFPTSNIQILLSQSSAKFTNYLAKQQNTKDPKRWQGKE